MDSTLAHQPTTILLHASGLAAAIGKNRFKPIREELDRVWARHDMDGYIAAHERCQIPTTEEALHCAVHALPYAGETLKNASAVAAATECSKETLLAMESFKNEMKLQLADTCKPAQDALDRAVKADAPQAVLTELTAALHTASKSQSLIQTEVDRVLKTEYGIHHESDNIGHYEKLKRRRVTRTDKFYVCVLSTMEMAERTWVVKLGGRVDGLIEDYGPGTLAVLETKNRVRRLFKRVVDYEKVQLHSYMHLVGCNHCILLECLRHEGNAVPEMHEMVVRADEKYWSEVTGLACNFAKAFVEITQQDPDTYLRLSDADKEKFLRLKVCSC